MSHTRWCILILLIGILVIIGAVIYSYLDERFSDDDNNKKEKVEK